MGLWDDLKDKIKGEIDKDKEMKEGITDIQKKASAFSETLSKTKSSLKESTGKVKEYTSSVTSNMKETASKWIPRRKAAATDQEDEGKSKAESEEAEEAAAKIKQEEEEQTRQEEARQEEEKERQKAEEKKRGEKSSDGPKAPPKKGSYFERDIPKSEALSGSGIVGNLDKLIEGVSTTINTVLPEEVSEGPFRKYSPERRKEALERLKKQEEEKAAREARGEVDEEGEGDKEEEGATEEKAEGEAKEEEEEKGERDGSGKGQAVAVKEETPWERFTRETRESRAYQSINNLKQAAQESDNVFIQKTVDGAEAVASAAKKVFGASEASEILSVVSEKDPSFNLFGFIDYVEEEIPVLLGAFFSGDEDTLKVMCGEAAYSKLIAHYKMVEKSEEPKRSELIEVEAVDFENAILDEGDPVISVIFVVQQIDFVVDKNGETTSQHTVANVHYQSSWRFNSDTLTWVIADVNILGQFALIA